MLSEYLRIPQLAQDWVKAGGIFALYVALALVVRVFWIRLLKPVLRSLHADFVDRILTPVRRLLIVGLLLNGVETALTHLRAVETNTALVTLLDKAVAAAWVLLLVLAALRIFNAALDWYVRRAAERIENPRDLGNQAALIQKIGYAILVAIGLLYILRALGVETTPLLASGAIGGLAVAWAFQDTLSNLFAGYFLTIDNAFNIGDWIRLTTGEEGFIEEFGWRNARMRTLTNNVVVIPNARLGQTTLTNYSQPAREMSLVIPCRVTPTADLHHVEAVTLEVAARIQQETQGAVSGWQPVVRWREFGDYAVLFQTILRVQEYDKQFPVQSEFIKALHTRFGEEGIALSVPAVPVELSGAKNDGHRNTSRFTSPLPPPS